MRIERFRIQGYKSIVDLTVDGLSDINVFFGLNSVGKSNIFEALQLWHRFAGENTGRTSISPDKPLYSELVDKFQLDGNGIITIDVEFTVEEIRGKSHFTVTKGENLERQVAIETIPPNISPPIGRHISEYLFSLLKFHVIDATRRLHYEQRTSGIFNGVVNAENLKQALFYAYLSSDTEQKKRLNAIKRALAAAPYSLGELDVALDPNTDQIDIGFVRANGRISLEDSGSGAQQLLLVLGQIFLNNYPVIAVEEPEMNLSPQYQAQMMSTLETLMQDPAVKLEQLFISTHSPYLEFTQNFYDVTYDPVKGTQIHHATNADYNQHFAIIPTGPDTGARLNSMNQVKLYEGVISDLGLKRGDLVVFVPTDDGRWEIRSGEALADELHAVTNGSIG
jgi:predicted ATPase